MDAKQFDLAAEFVIPHQDTLDAANRILAIEEIGTDAHLVADCLIRMTEANNKTHERMAAIFVPEDQEPPPRPILPR